MEAYIRGIGNISPQQSWDNTSFPVDVVIHDGSRLKCLEPDYKKYIKPVQMRRMSRILKMGVSAAMKCLHDAEVENPDAIIAGTGFGMFADTLKFLRMIIDNDESMLTPTSFIQSTHNTIGAHIAVMLKCNKYNFTYVDDYLSFESALLDSMIRIKENPDEKILLAGIDEMTDSLFIIREKEGICKQGIKNNMELMTHNGSGTILGEGASFFTVTGAEHPDNYAKFAGVKTFYKPGSDDELDKFILDFLADRRLNINDIDFLLSGINGDAEGDMQYDRLHNTLFRDIATGFYKHLCGEYYTASSFASWLGAKMLKEQAVPAYINLNKVAVPSPMKNILIYNQHNNTRHGLILLTAC